MQELSITQEFLLCSLNGKGKLPLIGKEVPACFVASAIIELVHEGVIVLEGSKIALVKKLDSDLAYLEPLYQEILKAKDADTKKILQNYIMSLTEQKLTMLLSSVGNALNELGCVVMKEKGIFVKKAVYLPNVESKDRVVEKLRAEILEEGSISDEVMALFYLLDKSKQLKQYFSKYEEKKLKERIQEARNSTKNQEMKAMVEQIEGMMAAITAMLVSSSLH